MNSKYLPLLIVVIFLWLCGFVLVGCDMPDFATTNKYDITPIPQAGSDDLTLEAERQLPTATIRPAFTPTTVPPTSTPLPTSTIPPSPTLSPTEIDAIIFDLYENNGGCLFPCFWGFIPGQTKWETVEQSVTPLAYLIDSGNSKPSEGELVVAYVYLILSQVSPVPESHLYGVKNGIIVALDVSLLPVSDNTIPAILDAYGQPSEIWLLTASAPMDDVLGFSLTLFYAQHHFMLTYSNWDGEIIDGKVRGCLSGEEESLHLVTWSPEEKLTFVEAEHGLHEPRPIIYDLPLEEATGISVETFYQTFKNGSEPICLETPTELWPGP
jgi:hypothetical protein